MNPSNEGTPGGRTSRPKSLGPSFARRLQRSVLSFAFFAAIVFGIAVDQLMSVHARRSLVAQAELCAAALVPGPNGALRISVDHLRSRFSGLMAVGTLDAFGALYSVYPDRPAHREAARTLLKRPGVSVDMAAPETGESVSVAGVVVALNGSDSPTARKVLVLLRTHPYRPALVRATMVFASVVGLMGLVCSRSMKRWFDRRVAKPLREMAAYVQMPPDGQEPRTAPEPGEWRETSQIVSGYRELLQSVAEIDAYAKRAWREAEDHVQQRKQRFDRQLRRVRDQATTDSLTRLRNRAFLAEEFDALFERQRDAGADLGAVMIDVDNFKTYNDTRGHQAGDALLQFVGALLKGAVRPSDHAIRYGGDEFLLLLPGASDKQAGAVAERVVKLFGQNAARLGGGDTLSLSAGIASLSKDRPASAKELLAKADAALYAAKREGKNAVSGYRAA